MINNRKTRIRKRLKARATRARLTVFVSNKQIYAQIVDDKKGHTLVSAASKNINKFALGNVEKTGGKNTLIAEKVGEILGQKAKEKNIHKVVFDRGGRRYHGRIRALAEAARSQGLKF